MARPVPLVKLEIVKDHVKGRVYYERDLVVAGDGALYQAERDTAATPPHTDWRCVTRAGRDGNDALNFRIEGTYDSDAKYRQLSIVMLNGSSFVARHDDPGPCPGDGWQLFTSVGKRGQQGSKGERASAVPEAPSRLRLGSPAAKSLLAITWSSCTRTILATPFHFARRSSNS